MSLWTKEDSANGAPKYLSDDDKANAFLVDETEAQVAENRAKGFRSPGWYIYRTYTDANGNTRNKPELLVPMRVTAAEAGDAGVEANTDIEDATVADS